LRGKKVTSAMKLVYSIWTEPELRAQ